jgi:hypothetical protein
VRPEGRLCCAHGASRTAGQRAVIQLASVAGRPVEVQRDRPGMKPRPPGVPECGARGHGGPHAVPAMCSRGGSEAQTSLIWPISCRDSSGVSAAAWSNSSFRSTRVRVSAPDNKRAPDHPGLMDDGETGHVAEPQDRHRAGADSGVRPGRERKHPQGDGRELSENFLVRHQMGGGDGNRPRARRCAHRCTSGAHQRERRPSTPRTDEISSAGQGRCGGVAPRPRTLLISSLPTGRLAPIGVLTCGEAQLIVHPGHFRYHWPRAAHFREGS